MSSMIGEASTESRRTKAEDLGKNIPSCTCYSLDIRPPWPPENEEQSEYSENIWKPTFQQRLQKELNWYFHDHECLIEYRPGEYNL